MVRSFPRNAFASSAERKSGLRHDLHQRHAGAIKIDKRHGSVLVVQRFAGILLEMEPLDADPRTFATWQIDQNFALADNR